MNIILLLTVHSYICPDGQWTPYGAWSRCSKTCGGGTQYRTRTCVGQQNGGKQCDGESTDERDCNSQNCPVNGYWLNWSTWGTCSKTCGGGTKTRSRDCTQPLFGGKNCVGQKIDRELCNTRVKCKGKPIHVSL